MNFKKFISGVSALTIAASAFAAMAVTANAATPTLTSTTAVNGYKTKAYYNFTKNTPEVLPTEGDMRYREDYGLHNFANGTRSATATIPVENGDILVVELYSANTTKWNDAISISCGSLNDSLTATFDESLNYRVFNITSDADSITFKNGNYNSIRAALVMEVDNTVKFNVNVKSSVGDVTFASGEVASGESLDYSFPKYLTDENNNVIAVSDATSFKASVTPVADGTITVPYTAYTGTAVAVEPVSTMSVSTDGKYSNANLFRALSTQTLTAPADGVYTATLVIVSNNVGEGKDRTVTIKNGDNAIDTITFNWNTVSKSIADCTFTSENIELNEGDVISFVPGDTQVAIDYILLEKTADLPSAQPDKKGFSFTEKIDDVKAKHLYVTATINGDKKMSDRGTVESLLPTNFTDATANLTVFLSNIPADYENVGVVID